MTTRILIVDDQDEIRAGIKAMLGSTRVSLLRVISPTDSRSSPSSGTIPSTWF